MALKENEEDNSGFEINNAYNLSTNNQRKYLQIMK